MTKHFIFVKRMAFVFLGIAAYSGNVQANKQKPEYDYKTPRITIANPAHFSHLPFQNFMIRDSKVKAKVSIKKIAQFKKAVIGDINTLSKQKKPKASDWSTALLNLTQYCDSVYESKLFNSAYKNNPNATDGNLDDCIRFADKLYTMTKIKKLKDKVKIQFRFLLARMQMLASRDISALEEFKSILKSKNTPKYLKVPSTVAASLIQIFLKFDTDKGLKKMSFFYSKSKKLRKLFLASVLLKFGKLSAQEASKILKEIEPEVKNLKGKHQSYFWAFYINWVKGSGFGEYPLNFTIGIPDSLGTPYYLRLMEDYIFAIQKKDGTEKSYTLLNALNKTGNTEKLKDYFIGWQIHMAKTIYRQDKNYIAFEKKLIETDKLKILPPSKKAEIRKEYFQLSLGLLKTKGIEIEKSFGLAQRYLDFAEPPKKNPKENKQEKETDTFANKSEFIALYSIAAKRFEAVGNFKVATILYEKLYGADPKSKNSINYLYSSIDMKEKELGWPKEPPFFKIPTAKDPKPYKKLYSLHQEAYKRTKSAKSMSHLGLLNIAMGEKTAAIKLWEEYLKTATPAKFVGHIASYLVYDFYKNKYYERAIDIYRHGMTKKIRMVDYPGTIDVRSTYHDALLKAGINANSKKEYPKSISFLEEYIKSSKLKKYLNTAKQVLFDSYQGDKRFLLMVKLGKEILTLSISDNLKEQVAKRSLKVCSGMADFELEYLFTQFLLSKAKTDTERYVYLSNILHYYKIKNYVDLIEKTILSLADLSQNAKQKIEHEQNYFWHKYRTANKAEVTLLANKLVSNPNISKQELASIIYAVINKYGDSKAIYNVEKHVQSIPPTEPLKHYIEGLISTLAVKKSKYQIKHQDIRTTKNPLAILLSIDQQFQTMKAPHFNACRQIENPYCGYAMYLFLPKADQTIEAFKNLESAVQDQKFDQQKQIYIDKVLADRNVATKTLNEHLQKGYTPETVFAEFKYSIKTDSLEWNKKYNFNYLQF